MYKYSAFIRCIHKGCKSGPVAVFLSPRRQHSAKYARNKDEAADCSYGFLQEVVSDGRIYTSDEAKGAKQFDGLNSCLNYLTQTFRCKNHMGDDEPYFALDLYPAKECK